MAEIVEKRGPGDQGTRGTGDCDGNEGDQGTGDDEGTRGPAKGTGEISLLIGTRGDQRDRRWLR